MKSESQPEPNALYQQAVEIIRQEWLAEGMTPEEWDRSERVADLFSREIGAGKDADEILTHWQGLTVEQILAEATLPGCSDRSSPQEDRAGKTPGNQRREAAKTMRGGS